MKPFPEDQVSHLVHQMFIQRLVLKNSFLVMTIIDKFCKSNSGITTLVVSDILGIKGISMIVIRITFHLQIYMMNKSNNIHKICTDSYSTIPRRVQRSLFSLGFKNEIQVTSHKNTVVQKSGRINLKADIEKKIKSRDKNLTFDYLKYCYTKY